MAGGQGTAQGQHGVELLLAQVLQGMTGNTTGQAALTQNFGSIEVIKSLLCAAAWKRISSTDTKLSTPNKGRLGLYTSAR